MQTLLEWCGAVEADVEVSNLNADTCTCMSIAASMCNPNPSELLFQRDNR